MKKFLRTIAVTLALVMAIDTPVSAAGISASDVTSGTATVLEGDDKGGDITDTNDGGDKPAKPTDDGGDKPTNDGEDWATGDGADLPVQVIAVTIEGSNVRNVEKDDEGTLTATVVTGSKEYTVKPVWKSSNDDVVKVTPSDDGMSCEFEAVRGGSAKITVTAGNKIGSRHADVTINVKEYSKRIEFKYAPENGVCYVKHKVDPTEWIQRYPETANDEITFSVDCSAKIATVDKNGLVNMKKVSGNKFTLTAITEKGVVGKTDIEIKAGNPVKKLKMGNNKQDVLFGIDKTFTIGQSGTDITYEAAESGPTTDRFEWTSSKPKIVEVVPDETGLSAKVSVIGVGKANVTVKASSGKKVVIKITAKAPLTALDIVRDDKVTEKGKGTNAQDPVEVYPKQKITLRGVKTPGINADKIKWSTSDKTVATVSGKKDNTAVVTVKNKKEAFSVKAECDGKEKTFYFNVLPSVAENVTLADNNPTALRVGEKARFAATVSGTGATNDMITWSSTNSKVLSINSNGYVTAHKAGKAKIKATVYNAQGRAKSATTSFITVIQPITSMSFKKPVVTVFEDAKKNVSLSMTVAPKGAKGIFAYEVKVSRAGSTIESYATVQYKDTKSNCKVIIPANKAKNDDIITVTAKAYDTKGETQVLTAVATARILVVAKKPKVEVNFDTCGVEGATWKKNTLTIKPGDKVELENDKNPCVKVTPASKNQDITYTVSKNGVVVIKGGYMYAVAPGKVKVTAKATSGVKKAFTVKVEGKAYIGTHPGDDETHPGADETHPGADETHPGADKNAKDGSDKK